MNRMKVRLRGWGIIAGILFILGSASPCCLWAAPEEANVKMKILAVNPEPDSLKTTVVQYLPAEVKPDDILDKAGMDVKFDVEKKSYALVKEIELQPKETKTFEVVVKNVWMIDESELQNVRNQLQETVNSLQGTKYGQTAKLLYEKVVESINGIEDAQSKPMGIKQRIDLYRIHVKQLDNIRKDGFSLEAMRLLDEERKGGIKEVKFWITARNPSDEPRKMSVRTALPKEVAREHILDKLDFALAYDQEQQRYLLEKEDNFQGKETKKYAVTLRNVWFIPQADLDFLLLETDKLVKVFETTPYNLYAQERGKFIDRTLKEIVSLQDEVASSAVLDDRIRAFVLNTQRKELIKKKIRELQDLLPEVPLKASESEFMKRNALQHLVKNIMKSKDLVLVAIGVQPNTPITWWISFGIIGFLGFLTLVFYLTWLKKLQQNRFIKAPGKKTSTAPPPKQQASV